MEAKKDLQAAIWIVGIATIVGLYLLGQYYNRMDLAVLALTVIAGNEYFHLKRQSTRK